MKLKPHEPPKPVTDPKQRIEYLRSFLGRISPEIPSSSYAGWCEHIRSDINAIADEAVQTQAKALFEQILSAMYFPNPTMDVDSVKAKTENLITFLEKHDS